MHKSEAENLYSYVGPNELKAFPSELTERCQVICWADVAEWMSKTIPAQRKGSVVATFVVDSDGLLWIADRHSEHVACARGADVISAGEMTFEIDGGRVIVTDVTNQSTGYCPEPESWPVVAAALDKAGITHPDGFTRAFLFRLCKSCGQTNIVKEGNFTCAVCGNGLKQEWNFPHGRK